MRADTQVQHTSRHQYASLPHLHHRHEQARSEGHTGMHKQPHAPDYQSHSTSHTCTLAHICSMIRTREQLTCARHCLGMRRHGLTDTRANVSVHIHVHTQAYTQSQRQTLMCTLTHTETRNTHNCSPGTQPGFFFPQLY